MVEDMNRVLESMGGVVGSVTVTENPVSPTAAISGLVISLSGTVRLKN